MYTILVKHLILEYYNGLTLQNYDYDLYKKIFGMMCDTQSNSKYIQT